jgi:hypothetical protein
MRHYNLIGYSVLFVVWTAGVAWAVIVGLAEERLRPPAPHPGADLGVCLLGVRQSRSFCWCARGGEKLAVPVNLWAAGLESTNSLITH